MGERLSAKYSQCPYDNDICDLADDEECCDCSRNLEMRDEYEPEDYLDYE